MFRFRVLVVCYLCWHLYPPWFVVGKFVLALAIACKTAGAARKAVTFAPACHRSGESRRRFLRGLNLLNELRHYRADSRHADERVENRDNAFRAFHALGKAGDGVVSRFGRLLRNRITPALSRRAVTGQLRLPGQPGAPCRKSVCIPERGLNVNVGFSAIGVGVGVTPMSTPGAAVWSCGSRRDRRRGGLIGRFTSLREGKVRAPNIELDVPIVLVCVRAFCRVAGQYRSAISRRS